MDTDLKLIAGAMSALVMRGRFRNIRVQLWLSKLKLLFCRLAKPLITAQAFRQYRIPRRGAATYFLEISAEKSLMPTSKSVVISIAPANA